MDDEFRAKVDYSTYQTISRLDKATGGLNIALGAVLAVDGIIIAVMAVVCLVMSFSLFFIAAIPAFLVTGFLCILAFVAAAANIITGATTAFTSQKFKRLHKVFSVITIAVDIAVIPANIVSFICGVYLISSDIDYLSVMIFIVAVLAILLAIASLTLSTVRIVKQKNSL